MKCLNAFAIFNQDNIKGTHQCAKQSGVNVLVLI